MYLILESLPVYLSNVICGTASKQTYCIIILTEIDANEIAMVLIRITINKSACLRFSKNANINRNTDAAKKTAIIVRITDKSVFLGDITKQADKQNEDNKLNENDKLSENDQGDLISCGDVNSGLFASLALIVSGAMFKINIKRKKN